MHSDLLSKPAAALMVEKAVAAERQRCLDVVERVKSNLRNGGARNACDQIASEIRQLVITRAPAAGAGDH